MVVLSAVTALAVVLSLVLAGLFFVASGDLSENRATVASQKEQLAAKEAKIVKVEDERDKARQDLDTRQDELGVVSEDKKTIASCLKLLLQLMTAAGAGNRAQVEKLAKQLDQPCTRAEALVS